MATIQVKVQWDLEERQARFQAGEQLADEFEVHHTDPHFAKLASLVKRFDSDGAGLVDLSTREGARVDIYEGARVDISMPGRRRAYCMPVRKPWAFSGPATAENVLDHLQRQEEERRREESEVEAEVARIEAEWQRWWEQQRPAETQEKRTGFFRRRSIGITRGDPR